MSAKLESYRVFCQVAKCLSFSQAAQELYLSQPAVSLAVRQLEDTLGVQLLVRSSKKVSLTAEGQLLYEYASSALGLLNSAERQLRGIQGLSAGELKIGAGDITARHLLLPYLERFHQLYPQVKLSILNRTSHESLELIGSGKLDIAFVNLPIDDSDLVTVHREFPIRDVFVAGSRFAHLRGKNLTLRQLAQQPLILLEHKANSRKLVEREFLRQGIALSPEIELASYGLLLEFARINLGIACVVQEFSQGEPCWCDGDVAELSDLNGKVFPIQLTTPLPRRSVGMVSLKGVSLSPAASRMLDLLFTDFCRNNE